MRHPYATLLVIGLATAGVISIGEKVKCFCFRRRSDISTMMQGIKGGGHPTDRE